MGIEEFILYTLWSWSLQGVRESGIGQGEYSIWIARTMQVEARESEEDQAE